MTMTNNSENKNNNNIMAARAVDQEFLYIGGAPRASQKAPQGRPLLHQTLRAIISCQDSSKVNVSAQRSLKMPKQKKTCMRASAKCSDIVSCT